MSPRRPGPPAHLDPTTKYPSHEAKRTADLLPYVNRPVATLTDAVETITRGKMRDEVKQALLLDAVREAMSQLDEARRIVAEYAVLHGKSLAVVAANLDVSHTQVGKWYHNPLPLDELRD